MGRVFLCGSDDGYKHYSLGMFEDPASVEYEDEPPFCPYAAATCEHHCTAGARACVDGP